MLIDIPINLQQDQIEYDFPTTSINPKKFEISAVQIMDFKSHLLSATRPLLLIGGGVRTSNATHLLSEFIDRTGIPYVSTLLGLDSVSHMNDKYLGFIGSYGNRWANAAVDQSDLLIVIGSRLDVRQTGNDISRFTSGKRIIRVDIDNHELTGRISSDINIVSDASDFLKAVLNIDVVIDCSQYIFGIREIEKNYPQKLEQDCDLTLNPNTVMECLGEVFSESSGFVIDVGQHQMWAAQSIRLRDGQRFLTSGGLGAMGFALPASIGASVAHVGRWVSISGDGCLQLSSPELQTIAQYKLPIAVCVINNGQHGMVAQFQEENMNGRFTGTREGFSNPNFQDLARSYGFKNVFKIEHFTDLEKLEKQIVNIGNEAIFLEFVIDSSAKALPKMSANE